MYPGLCSDDDGGDNKGLRCKPSPILANLANSEICRQSASRSTLQCQAAIVLPGIARSYNSGRVDDLDFDHQLAALTASVTRICRKTHFTRVFLPVLLLGPLLNYYVDLQKILTL